MLLEAGEGLLELKPSTNADGEPDFEVCLDRSKILTVGKPAIGRFLLALQVHKSLGDLEAGTALFAKYSAVDDAMLGIRSVVMARKEPRKLLVQPVLQPDGDAGVALRSFDASPQVRHLTLEPALAWP